jgi:hypothetical protein
MIVMWKIIIESDKCPFKLPDIIFEGKYICSITHSGCNIKTCKKKYE